MVILPLHIDGLEIRRRGKRLLGPVSHRVDAGGVTIVLGPNGAGKTTLLRAIHGLERAAKGHIHWAAPQEQARRKCSFVFQSPTALRRSLRDNIAYPLIVSGISKTKARNAAEQAAQKVGLSDHLDTGAEHLSGGERQKMALARALITRPEVLLLDEPCANLDGAATREIETILQRARDAGTTILMSTHAMGQARRLADRVVFLHRGRVVETGRSDVFFENPETPEARAHLKGDLVI